MANANTKAQHQRQQTNEAVHVLVVFKQSLHVACRLFSVFLSKRERKDWKKYNNKKKRVEIQSQGDL